MKKILFILCILSTTVNAKNLQFECSKVKDKDAVAFVFGNSIGSLGLNRIFRCENDEVVCYVTSGERDDNIFCKFK